MVAKWRFAMRGAGRGELLRPRHASKLRRRRSGVCRSGLSPWRHQAGAWSSSRAKGTLHQLQRRYNVLSEMPCTWVEYRRRQSESAKRLGIDLVAAYVVPLETEPLFYENKYVFVRADGTIDLSPSSRLFITEAEIITKLYNGIKLLKEKEDTAGN